MNNPSLATPAETGARAVIAALEIQLVTLDRLGAHIAAAHVDSAIQQLRRDLGKS